MVSTDGTTASIDGTDGIVDGTEAGTEVGITDLHLETRITAGVDGVILIILTVHQDSIIDLEIMDSTLQQRHLTQKEHITGLEEMVLAQHLLTVDQSHQD